MTYPKLYTRNSNGSINVWWAEVLEDGSYITNYGQVDGKIQTTQPVTCQPKNTGKKNATSAQDQAQKEVDALYKKQRKSNYFDDIALIDNAWKGIQANWMTLTGLVCIFIGLIQLWEQILGMILLTLGILLISGFFQENNK